MQEDDEEFGQESTAQISVSYDEAEKCIKQCDVCFILSRSRYSNIDVCRTLKNGKFCRVCHGNNANVLESSFASSASS